MQPIGREADVAAVLARVEASFDGAGSIVLVEGEAGAGKSLVLDAVVNAARARGAAVMTSRSWALSASVPYESFIAAVSRHLRQLADVDVARLTAGLHTLGALIDGLDLAPSDVAPEAFKARAHDALATLVRRIAADAPVVLVFDDFHWFDQASLEALQYLCVDLRDDRIVVVLAMRPDELDARQELRQFVSSVRRSVPGERVVIGRLDPEQVDAVVRARLDGAVALRIVELVVARSGGTPLFVHELVDDLVDRGAVARVDGVWQLVAGEVPLPHSVRDAIRDRVDRVAARDRAVLETLAVVNDVTSPALVAEVMRVDVEEVDAALGRLTRHRLVAVSAGGDGRAGWAVEHPLVAEVVEAELLPAARRRLHRQVLDADPDAPIGRRARHAIVAADPADRPGAVRLLAAAGALAIAGGAPSAAIEPLRVALDWLGDADDPVLRGVIERDLGTAHVRRLEPRDALVHLRAAWSRAEAADHTERMVELLPLIDDAEFLLGAEGLGSIAIGGLQERLAHRGEWDLLAEVAALRFARGGRALRESEIEEALIALRSIPAHARTGGAAAAFDVLELCVTTAVAASARTCEQWVDEMLMRAPGVGAWPEHQVRLLLITLDVASQSGDPRLVGRVVEPLAEAERRTGRRPNWRLPVIQAFHSAAAGRLDEAIIDHQINTRGGRRHPLSVLIEACVLRAVEGPAASVAAFERAAPAFGVDRTAALYRVFARLLLGLGTEQEPAAAAAVVDAIAPAPIGVVTRLMMFGGGAPLARALAGGDDAADAVAELDALGGGTGLPSAWAWLARSRLAATDAARATALLRSADILTGLGRHLDAAERVIDAAEASAGDVPADRLAAAAEVVDRSGATWLATRVAALRPAARGPGLADDAGLTAREREVVGLVADGLTNREVAAALYISVRTVTSHLDHVYTKLGLSSRPALIDWYRSR